MLESVYGRSVQIRSTPQDLLNYCKVNLSIPYKKMPAAFKSYINFDMLVLTSFD